MSTVSIRYIVCDVDAAIDFYTTCLQFELQMHPNDLFAMLGRGDLRLVLVKPTGPQGPAGGGAAMPDGRMQEPGGWNRFSVEVPDLAATVTELRSRGARLRRESSFPQYLWKTVRPLEDQNRLARTVPCFALWLRS